MKQKILFLSFLLVWSTTLFGGMFNTDSYFKEDINVEKIGDVALKMPGGIKGRDISRECRKYLQKSSIKVTTLSTMNCYSQYKRYNQDPYDFIRKFVDKAMDMEENEFELTPSRSQKLDCEDMMVGMNKGTMEMFFPKFDGAKLADYAMSYCMENYSKNYLK